MKQYIEPWSAELTSNKDRLLIREEEFIRGYYDLITAMPSFCQKCMYPFTDETKCTHHISNEELDRTLAVSMYWPIKKYGQIRGLSDLMSQHILNLKHNMEYAKPIAAAMILCLRENIFPDFRINDIDYIIPIPRHREELKRDINTGVLYNQAELLASQISEFFNIPIINDALIKNRAFSMHNRSREERIRLALSGYNVNEAYISQIEGANILLIDDARTTGATLHACSKYLKEKGARSVYGYVAGRSIIAKEVRECLLKI